MPKRKEKEKEPAGKHREHRVGSPAGVSDGLGVVWNEEEKQAKEHRNRYSVHDPLQDDRGHRRAPANRAPLVDQERARELSQSKGQQQQHHEANPGGLVELAEF